MDFPERINTENHNAPYAEIVMHQLRYRLAVSQIKSSNVKNPLILDAGCGTGYGSAMLANNIASTVEGVDIDKESVESNRETYSENKNLSFNISDLTKIQAETPKYDFITCFEVIEHISFEDGQQLMKNFHKLLKPGGKLFISSPNFGVSKALYRLRLSKPNPFHIHEYEVNELSASLISAGFKLENIYGQFPFFPIFYFFTSPELRFEFFFSLYRFLPKNICRYFLIEARK